MIFVDAFFYVIDSFAECGFAFMRIFPLKCGRRFGKAAGDAIGISPSFAPMAEAGKMKRAAGRMKRLLCKHEAKAMRLS